MVVGLAAQMVPLTTTRRQKSRKERVTAYMGMSI